MQVRKGVGAKLLASVLIVVAAAGVMGPQLSNLGSNLGSSADQTGESIEDTSELGGNIDVGEAPDYGGTIDGDDGDGDGTDGDGDSDVTDGDGTSGSPTSDVLDVQWRNGDWPPETVSLGGDLWELTDAKFVGEIPGGVSGDMGELVSVIQVKSFEDNSWYSLEAPFNSPYGCNIQEGGQGSCGQIGDDGMNYSVQLPMTVGEDNWPQIHVRGYVYGTSGELDGESEVTSENHTKIEGVPASELPGVVCGTRCVSNNRYCGDDAMCQANRLPSYPDQFVKGTRCIESRGNGGPTLMGEEYGGCQVQGTGTTFNQDDLIAGCQAYEDTNDGVGVSQEAYDKCGRPEQPANWTSNVFDTITPYADDYTYWGSETILSPDESVRLPWAGTCRPLEITRMGEGLGVTVRDLFTENDVASGVQPGSSVDVADGETVTVEGVDTNDDNNFDTVRVVGECGQAQDIEQNMGSVADSTEWVQFCKYNDGNYPREGDEESVQAADVYSCMKFVNDECVESNYGDSQCRSVLADMCGQLGMTAVEASYLNRNPGVSLNTVAGCGYPVNVPELPMWGTMERPVHGLQLTAEVGGQDAQIIGSNGCEPVTIKSYRKTERNDEGYDVVHLDIWHDGSRIFDQEVETAYQPYGEDQSIDEGDWIHLDPDGHVEDGAVGEVAVTQIHADYVELSTRCPE